MINIFHGIQSLLMITLQTDQITVLADLRIAYHLESPYGTLYDIASLIIHFSKQNSEKVNHSGHPVMIS